MLRLVAPLSSFVQNDPEDHIQLVVGQEAASRDFYKLDEFDGITSTHYKKTAKFTPYAGVVYDINDTYSAYASYTEIFNPQSSYRNVNNQVLPPTNGKNTEVGLKGEYLDGRLNASIALFETRLDNLAQAENYALPNGTWAYHTVNGTKSRGVEFDLQGELADDWNIYGGVAHFNSTDATGERLSAYLPRTTARLFTTYRLPGDWSKLTVGGGGDVAKRHLPERNKPARCQRQCGTEILRTSHP